MQAPWEGCDATPVAEAGPASRDDWDTNVGQVVPSRRALTLECLQEVAQSPPLTKDQLVGIAGNLCCCLTKVRTHPILRLYLPG
jgi:hypothetical protein